MANMTIVANITIMANRAIVDIHIIVSNRYICQTNPPKNMRIRNLDVQMCNCFSCNELGDE